MKTVKRTRHLLFAICYVTLLAVLGSLAGAGMEGWYQTLHIPTWAPTGEFIGAVWTVLFALLAFSLILLLDILPPFAYKRAGLLFLLNGILNVGWSVVFFSFQRIDVAVFVALALTLSVATLVIETARFSRLIPVLLMPYLLWTGFATYLNYEVVKLNTPSMTPQSFEECLMAGFPIMESYPRQCRAGSASFTENIGNANEKLDLIRVATPRPGDTVKSPLTVRGEARGNWFFEASFPVKVVDENGKVIGNGVAQAEDEWMTTEFVPFTVTIKLTATSAHKASLILEKDNPSGLSQNDDSLTIPINL
jgi:benzodiazapine receptor